MPDLMHPYCDSFFFEGDPGSIVFLIHGFTGSPAQMRLLGESLAERGHSVRCIRLPGHGTSMGDMARTHWRDWLGAAESELDTLLKTYPRVRVVGFSMGGVIALNLAARRREPAFDRVVTVSAPMAFQNRAILLAPVAWPVKRYVYWEKGLREGQLGMPYSAGYPGMPLRSVAHLQAMMRRTRRLLPDLSKPILVIQSLKDESVDLRSPQVILGRVASAYKEEVLLENSWHNCLTGTERQRAFDEIARFLSLDPDSLPTVPGGLSEAPIPAG